MRFAGITPVEAPDPGDELRVRVERLGFGVAGFVRQPHLEDWGALGLTEQRAGAGKDAQLEHATVSRSYTLWRNPQDRRDPLNLSELDEMTRRPLDEVPPWPRPAWLLQRVERMRYPMLREAVQTHWSAPQAAARPAADRLVEHVQYVLNNQYRVDNEMAISSIGIRETPPRVLPMRVDIVGARITGNLLRDRVPDKDEIPRLRERSSW